MFETELERVSYNFIHECLSDCVEPIEFGRKFNKFASESHFAKRCPETQSTFLFALFKCGTFEGSLHPLVFPYLGILIDITFIDLLYFLKWVVKLEHDFRGLRSIVYQVHMKMRIIQVKTEEAEVREELAVTFVGVIQWLVKIICDQMDLKKDPDVMLMKECQRVLIELHNDHFARVVILYILFSDKTSMLPMYDRIDRSIDLIDQRWEEQEHLSTFSIDHEEFPDPQDISDPRDVVYILKDIVSLFAYLPEWPVGYKKTFRYGTTHAQPSILTLTVIYMLQRPTLSTHEMLDEFRNLADVFLYSQKQMLKEVIRGAFLVQIESASDPLRQPVIDAFIYHKIPDIIHALSRRYHLDTVDLVSVLSKIADEKSLCEGASKFQQDDVFKKLLLSLRSLNLINEEHVRVLTTRASFFPAEFDEEIDVMEDNFFNDQSDSDSEPDILSKIDKTIIVKSTPIIEMTKEDIKHAQEDTSTSSSIDSHDETQMETDNDDLVVSFASVAINTNLSSRCLIFQTAKQAASQLCGTSSKPDLNQFLENLSPGNLQVFDSTIAVIASTEKLNQFCDQVVQENKLYTDVWATPTAIHNFDLTFLILWRATKIFQGIPLEEIFCTTEDIYVAELFLEMRDYMVNKQPLKLDREKLQKLGADYQTIKSGQPIWDQTWTIKNILDEARAISEHILTIDEDEERLDEITLTNILASFGEFSCAYLMFCQWIYLAEYEQKQKVAGMAIGCAKKNLEVVKNKYEPKTYARWSLAVAMMEPLLEQLSKPPPPMEPVYPYLINCARRKVIQSDDLNVPNLNEMKNAFFNALTHGYVTPNIIDNIVNLNKKMKHAEWISCWLQQIIRHETQDELEVVAELCVSAALTSPVVCLLCMIRILTEENGFSPLSENVAHGYNMIFSCARIVVKIMTLLLSSSAHKEKRKKIQDERRRLLRKQRTVVKITTNSNEQDKTIQETLAMIVEQFTKVVDSQSTGYRTNFTMCFLEELCTSPPNKYKAQILELLPKDLLVRSIYLDPALITIPALLRTYDFEIAANRDQVLHAAVLLRHFHKI